LSLGATTAVLRNLTLDIKLDEEKSKHVGFTQQNGFGLAIFAQFVEACKGTAMPVTPCCWLAR
jgi:hypothetical protein